MSCDVASLCDVRNLVLSRASRETAMTKTYQNMSFNTSGSIYRAQSAHPDPSPGAEEGQDVLQDVGEER